jgi:transglutaminase-like putative cysteine protease
MSRRGFRVAVGDPRPTSAWLLVFVATGDARHHRPARAVGARRDRRRIRDLAVATHRTVRVADQSLVAERTHDGNHDRHHVGRAPGPASTVALAHFAATTQGLQLIDARPRKTEFLLVALALFQVVLAANLTDSVFFTPLLVAFVFAAVWTLVVHTLRSEALEAGQAREIPRAFTPGLARTAFAASAVAVLLAMLLFVALPRLQASVVRGPLIGGALAASGFSDRVELGALGRIRSDPSVVMRVETLEGRPPGSAAAYWRGLAFDTFDGRTWSITPPERTLVPGSAEGGVGLGLDPDRYDLVQRIVREPVEAGVLFRIGDPRGIQGTIRRLERDASGGLYAASQADERIRYTVRSLRAQPDDDDLRDDRALPPRRGGERLLARAPLSPAVGELAARIVADAKSDAERARAIEHYLMKSGHYTDTPPDPPKDGSSPLEGFLFRGLAGHCEYFASAMVVLAREVGLPARLVNGFAGGRTNEIGNFVVVAQKDAHAWVEIHFERAGWVRYDPTPADLRARAEPPLSFTERIGDFASALELWWFQRVVGFDRSDQIDVLKRAWLAWYGRSSETAAPEAAAPARIWRSALDRREWVIGLGVGAALAAIAPRSGRRDATGRAPRTPTTRARCACSRAAGSCARKAPRHARSRAKSPDRSPNAPRPRSPRSPRPISASASAPATPIPPAPSPISNKHFEPADRSTGATLRAHPAIRRTRPSTPSSRRRAPRAPSHPPCRRRAPRARRAATAGRRSARRARGSAARLALELELRLHALVDPERREQLVVLLGRGEDPHADAALRGREQALRHALRAHHLDPQVEQHVLL